MTKRTLLILLSSGLLLSANAWAEQKQLAAPGNQVIVVEHSTPEPSPSRDCDARYQAIRQVKGQPMEVSKVAHSAGCMAGVMDQKNFVVHFS